MSSWWQVPKDDERVKGAFGPLIILRNPMAMERPNTMRKKERTRNVPAIMRQPEEDSVYSSNKTYATVTARNRSHFVLSSPDTFNKASVMSHR